MFQWLRALLLIGLFAGLGLRASGAQFGCCESAGHGTECCEAAGSDKAALTEHTKDCPPYQHDHEHHHHGACCHVPAWVSIDVGEATLFPPTAFSSSLRGGNESPPDGPVMPLDKPPLV
ncbi:hypothetical protein KBB96_04670 [Luteolibacter ambystomatis]|uniref:Uncharacterized protein n=1 Tax=Luteolibacter ambystomatis TaxID=2824561 RepID=A0A975J197_9BACT|nr:hypothetical protein [Luteolibacter ambystomatis]QUE52186.1 hypothetical protein KBB96_04670 [Luteolibacter ambystomatis]